MNNRLRLFTHDIKNQLREIVMEAEHRPVPPSNAIFEERRSLNRDVPVVLTQRATGKTTGLIHFIGERTLILPESEKIAVICPSQNIAEEFSCQYNKHFPTLRHPVIFNAKNSVRILRGDKFREVYIEEFFLIPRNSLHDMLCYLNTQVLVGIGSVEQPTTISVRV